MSDFMTELRNAHSVWIAYQRGAKTLATLQRETNLPFIEVGSWTRLLKLPIAFNRNSSLQFPFRPETNAASLLAQDAAS
jgi:hypothetical protein